MSSIVLHTAPSSCRVRRRRPSDELRGSGNLRKRLRETQSKPSSPLARRQQPSIHRTVIQRHRGSQQLFKRRERRNRLDARQSASAPTVDVTAATPIPITAENATPRRIASSLARSYSSHAASSDGRAYGAKSSNRDDVSFAARLVAP